MDLKTAIELKSNATIYFPTFALAYVLDKTNDHLVFAGFIVAFILTAYYARVVHKMSASIQADERTQIVKMRDNGQKDEALQRVMMNSWSAILKNFPLYLPLYFGVIGSYLFALTALALVFNQLLACFLFAFGALAILGHISFILRNTLKSFVLFRLINQAVRKNMGLQ